jgi:hypothetical protein
VPEFSHSSGSESLPTIALHKGALHIGGAPVQASFMGNSCYWERTDEEGRNEKGLLTLSHCCMLAEGTIEKDGVATPVKATADLQYDLSCTRKSDGCTQKLRFGFGTYYGGEDEGTVFYYQLWYYDASGALQQIVSFDPENPAPQAEFSPHILADGKIAFDIDLSILWQTIGSFLWPDFFVYSLSFTLDETYSEVSKGRAITAIAQDASELLNTGESPDEPMEGEGAADTEEADSEPVKSAPAGADDTASFGLPDSPWAA